MAQTENYIEHLNISLMDFFKEALRISSRNPQQAAFLLKTLAAQKAAAKNRKKWRSHGVQVPPFMIASITWRCNLNCKGCYARSGAGADMRLANANNAVKSLNDADNFNAASELDTEKLEDIMLQAVKLGVSIILIAGGEPLLRPGILDIAAKHPDTVFPLFTNGTMIDDGILDKLARHRNLVPVISLEGYEAETDARRGEGVYDRVRKLFAKLQARRIFYGVSITVTSMNFDTVTSRDYVKTLMDSGSRLFFFVEYVPVKAGTEAWCLSEEQRIVLPVAVDFLRRRLPGLFVAFPGDEEASGGCLAAGRGFVHLSPDGRLEPCPFAPYSDVNLKDMPLHEALQSDFLSRIRANHRQLEGKKGGCALWENREMVGKLLYDDTDAKDAAIVR